MSSIEKAAKVLTEVSLKSAPGPKITNTNEQGEQMLDIPHAVSDLTPEWLSERLGCSVAGLHITALDGGVMSDTFKLGSITYRDPQADVPKSLVVKIASSVPELRTFGMAAHIYNKELNFYRHLAADVPVAIPVLYACGADGSDESEFFYILMEDLTSHSKVFDQVDDPPDGPFARKLALDCARLHAKYWESDTLRTPWLGGNASRYVFAGESLSLQAAQLWPSFRELYEQVYGHDFFAPGDFGPIETMIGQMCGPNSIAIYERMIDILSSRPRTLVHGDMRADNIFRTHPAFGKSVEDSVLTFVDWQALHAGPAGMEFGQAWFSSLEPEVRRNDLTYLAEYHAKLVTLEPAAAAYTFEMLLEDYRIGCCIWLMLLISLATGAFPTFHLPEQARAKALWATGWRRVRLAMLELDCPALIARLAADVS